MRKVRYSVAASLDGFIAGPNGEHDWIIMDPGVDFRTFFSSIDTVLLGRRTYEKAIAQGPKGSMPGVTSIVYSRTLNPKDHPGVTLHKDAAESVAALKARDEGKDIWLMGGGGLFRSLLEAGLVDTIEVGVVPVMLGAGVPLLPGPYGAFGLTLASSRVLDSGLLMLTYQPKAKSKGAKAKGSR
jgi:dihydrofolate reductase